MFLNAKIRPLQCARPSVNPLYYMPETASFIDKSLGCKGFSTFFLPELAAVYASVPGENSFF